MYCIGLTGGIASGKSTVSSYFLTLGIDVISADHIARTLTTSNQPAFDAIKQHFGIDVVTKDGELNRQTLRQIIFSSTHERQWLERLLHPLIRKQIELEVSQCSSPYCVIEIPLLQDKSDYPYLNRVLLIEAGPEQQLTRLMIRDKSSKEQALAIIATQTRPAMADDQIMNNGSIEQLQEKVDALHRQYLYCALLNDLNDIRNNATLPDTPWE